MKQSYNELNEEDVKKMFKKLDTPDMRDDIIDAVHGKKKHSPKRLSLRAAAVIAAAAMLTVAVGATAVAVASGEYRMKVTTGDPVERTNPDGSPAILDRFAIEIEPVVTDETAEPAEVEFEISEKALANFEPLYGEYSGTNEEIEKTFETSFVTLEEAEAFIDAKLYLPGKYRAHCETATVRGAYKTDGTVQLDVSIKAGSKLGDSINISFGTSRMGVAPAGTTEDEPVKFTLPDGTEAQAMLAYRDNDTGKSYTTMVYYVHNGVFYNFLGSDYPREENDDVRGRLIDTIAEILATVTDQPVDPADYPKIEQDKLPVAGYTKGDSFVHNLVPTSESEFAGMTYQTYDPSGRKLDAIEEDRVYDDYIIEFDKELVDKYCPDEATIGKLNDFIVTPPANRTQKTLEDYEDLLGVKFHIPEIIRNNINDVSPHIKGRTLHKGSSKYSAFNIWMMFRYELDGAQRYASISLTGTKTHCSSMQGYLDVPYTYELEDGTGVFVTIVNTKTEGRYFAHVDYQYDGIIYSLWVGHHETGHELDELLSKVQNVLDDFN